MSRVENRQSGQVLYDYGGTANRQTYISTGQQVGQPSNPQAASIFKTSIVQPVITSHPVHTVQRTSQFKTSNRGETITAGKEQRFDNYVKNEYKYNLFSILDEPWNRCLQAGKCGPCPGNQCIARQARKQTWNWI